MLLCGETGENPVRARRREAVFLSSYRMPQNGKMSLANAEKTDDYLPSRNIRMINILPFDTASSG